MPIGSTSVFSKLNFAPEARHHFLRMSSRSEYRSSLERYIVVSSAYILTIILSSRPGILYPLNFGEFLNEHASGSIAKSKRRQDNGSPCRTPLVTLKDELRNPLMAICV